MEPSRGQILLNRGKQQIQHLQQVYNFARFACCNPAAKVNNKIQHGFHEWNLRGDITPGEINWKCVQGEALCFVVSQQASLDLHGPRKDNVPAKRCVLLFRNKQALICMGLEKTMSPRSVVQSCKSCSSCFPISAGRIGNASALSLQISDATFSAPFSASRAPLSCDCWTIVG